MKDHEAYVPPTADELRQLAKDDPVRALEKIGEAFERAQAAVELGDMERAKFWVALTKAMQRVYDAAATEAKAEREARSSLSPEIRQLVVEFVERNRNRNYSRASEPCRRTAATAATPPKRTRARTRRREVRFTRSSAARTGSGDSDCGSSDPDSENHCAAWRGDTRRGWSL